MLFRHLRSSGVAGAAALLTVTAPLIIAGASPVAVADDCPDAEVVFARGTDEPVGMGRVGDALVDSLRKQAGSLIIRSYAVDYKATITQRHSGEGAKDAISHIKSTVAACPNTKIVLGGYSQGASVVNIVAGFDGVNWGDPLPPEYVKNVAAVATFGNVADRTGGAPPLQDSPLSAKAIDLCNPADPDLSRRCGQFLERAYAGLYPRVHRSGRGVCCVQAACRLTSDPARVRGAAGSAAGIWRSARSAAGV